MKMGAPNINAATKELGIEIAQYNTQIHFGNSRQNGHLHLHRVQEGKFRA
jgi:hypothetical protein